MSIADKAKENSHYYKDVSHLETIDFYRICKLYEITDPCAQHALKKLLCLGVRSGGKTYEQDIKDARDSLNRMLQMIEEDQVNDHEAIILMSPAEYMEAIK